MQPCYVSKHRYISRLRLYYSQSTKQCKLSTELVMIGTVYPEQADVASWVFTYLPQ